MSAAVCGRWRASRESVVWRRFTALIQGPRSFVYSRAARSAADIEHDPGTSLRTSPRPSPPLGAAKPSRRSCAPADVARRGGQAAEEVERVGGASPWVGGVGEDGEAGVEDDFQALVVELEVADVPVVEVLDAADVEADVVAGPVLAELVAAGRQLADEVGELAVVRVAAGGRAQRGDDVACDAVPVEVEVAGARIEEDEARGVRPLVAVEHLEEERVAERVG